MVGVLLCDFFGFGFPDAEAVLPGVFGAAELVHCFHGLVVDGWVAESGEEEGDDVVDVVFRLDVFLSG